MIQGLILVPLAPASPVVVKNLPLIELIRSDPVLRKLKSALKKHHQ